MKIAVLCSHTPSLFWFRMDMMLDFISLGHDVIAVGNEPENRWKDDFAEYGIKYIQAEIQRNGTNPVKDLQTLKSLKAILKKEMPDRIFAYQAKTVIYSALAAKSLGIKEVYPLIAGLGSVFLKNGFKAKFIRFILKSEYKFSLKNCPKVFFQNNDDVNTFTSQKIIGKDKAVILNGSGVNLEKFTVQPFPEKFGFLCISRLIKDKGVFEYLEACKKVKQKYPNIRCLLVGPFDSNPSAIKREELRPFTDAGFVEYFGEQTDVRPFLEQCSVYVLPSYREGTPKTVLEAMASGKAVITTDAPGCRETVEDGVNGFLIPIKNSDILAEKMILLYENKELTEKMAVEGRKAAEERFDVKKVNEKIISTMNLRGRNK